MSMRNLALLAVILGQASACNWESPIDWETQVTCPKDFGEAVEVREGTTLKRSDVDVRFLSKVSRCANSLFFYDQKGETTIVHVSAMLVDGVVPLGSYDQTEAESIMKKVVDGVPYEKLVDGATVKDVIPASLIVSDCAQVWWDNPLHEKSENGWLKTDADGNVIENPSTEAVCQGIKLVESA